MVAQPRRALILALFVVALLGAGWVVARDGFEVAAAPSGAPVLPGAVGRLPVGRKVTFLELGSVGCKPCEAMKPVMDAVRKRFSEQVEVIFCDVRKDPAVAGRYGIRLIPTQVFLLPDGSEFFRHEGYFPESDVLTVLARMGLR
jgi:thioredoxin 1